MSSPSRVLSDGDRVLFARDAKRPLDLSLGTIVTLNRSARTAKVQAEADASEHVVAIADLRLFVMAGSLDDAHDLSLLPDTSEAATLFAVQQRFRARRIYSNVGPMLVAVNPFQWLQGLLDDPAAPHPQRLARAAWQGLLSAGTKATTTDDGTSNSSSSGGALDGDSAASSRAVVVITGQSGAGKTEAAKMVVREVAALSGSSSQLVSRLMVVDPILESFGNAATTNNDNSSRFAKYMEMLIAPAENPSVPSGRIEGCQIDCYLLEVSRVVRRNPKEGNFHIFHMLFADDGLTAEERAELDVWDPLLFAAMRSSGAAAGGATTAIAEDVQTPFRLGAVRNALTEIGVSAEEQSKVLRVLGGILHLLNIDFAASDAHSPATVSTVPSLVTAARLLGFSDASLPPPSLSPSDPPPPPGTLAAALTSVTLTIAGKTQLRRFNRAAATAARDTLAKVLYEGLFNFLLRAINKSLGGAVRAPSSAKRFGVLDIFGFETVDPANGVNDLEQLLINFANECVQGLYDDNVFGAHAMEAETEGVTLPPIEGASGSSNGDGGGGGGLGAPSSPTRGNDDAAAAQAVAGLSEDERRRRCVQVMTEKPHGVLSVIADEGALGQQQQQQQGAPDAAATNLADKILTAQGAFPDVLRRDKIKRNIFRLQHYCALVEYTVDNFTVKNRVQLSAAPMLKSSGDAFVVALSDLYQQAYGSGGAASSASGSPLTALGAATPRVAGPVSQVSLFRDQLQRLLGIMRASSLRWIRCIKPNLSKAPMMFNAPLVAQQLQTNGITRTLKLLGSGFSVRMPFVALARLVAPALALPPTRGGGGAFPAELVAECDFKGVVQFAAAHLPCLRDGAVILGATRAFMRGATLRELHELNAKFFAAAAAMWQRAGRALSARRGVARLLDARRKQQMAQQRLARIEAQRPAREALERQREIALDEASQLRLKLLPHLHTTAVDSCARVMAAFQAATARLASDLARVTNEIAAVTAASEAKEVAHYEYHHYSEQFRKELVAKASMEKQKREADEMRLKRQEAQREEHRKLAMRDELARAERERRMTKVYLGARAMQIKAETRILAEQRAVDEAQQVAQLERQVAKHLQQAKQRLQRRDAVAAHQHMLRETAERVIKAAPPVQPALVAVASPAMRAKSQAAPAAQSVRRSSAKRPQPQPHPAGDAGDDLDGQWAARKDLWLLLEAAVASGQRDARRSAQSM